jgi:Mrp family chromosome partitioning ATPase
MPGVDFVATGGYVTNASELLRQDSFKDFVDWANETYDLVLIDAPPVLLVADAGIIGQLAGTVFVIARQGTTSVAELRESVRRFEQVGVPIRGVIFNDMTRVRAVTAMRTPLTVIRATVSRKTRAWRSAEFDESVKQEAHHGEPVVGFFHSADECGRARVNGDKESIAKA